MDVTPRIVVTGPSRGGWPARFFTGLAVRRAGGLAVLSTPSDPFSDWGAADAVVLGGGVDIDPARYSREACVDAAVDVERDALEWTAVDRALARELPILGICRGAQLLNVYLGGTLHRDLRAEYVGHSPRRQIFALKRIEVEPGSRLWSALGTGALRVNSMHRQGVAKLGDGLVASARDRLGVVQGIERAADPLILGVQWHPEYLPTRPSQYRLFRALVEAARLRRAREARVL